MKCFLTNESGATRVTSLVWKRELTITYLQLTCYQPFAASRTKTVKPVKLHAKLLLTAVFPPPEINP